MLFTHLRKAHSVLMKMSSNNVDSSRVHCSLLGASWMSALWSPGVQPKVVPAHFNPSNNLFHQIVTAVPEKPFPTGGIWQLWIFPMLARVKTCRWKEKPWYLWIKFLNPKPSETWDCKGQRWTVPQIYQHKLPLWPLASEKAWWCSQMKLRSSTNSSVYYSLLARTD